MDGIGRLGDCGPGKAKRGARICKWAPTRARIPQWITSVELSTLPLMCKKPSMQTQAELPLVSWVGNDGGDRGWAEATALLNCCVQETRTYNPRAHAGRNPADRG